MVKENTEKIRLYIALGLLLVSILFIIESISTFNQLKYHVNESFSTVGKTINTVFYSTLDQIPINKDIKLTIKKTDLQNTDQIENITNIFKLSDK